MSILMDFIDEFKIVECQDLALYFDSNQYSPNLDPFYILYIIKRFSFHLSYNEEAQMYKLWILISVIVLVIGCSADPIIGQWERFGDEAAGSVVQVEVIGKVYHGRLLLARGVLKDLGFAENDIKWLDIQPVGPNKWRGKDLVKTPDASGNVEAAEYKDAYFSLLGDEILEIRKFVEEEEIGTVQKWRRVQ